MENGQMENLYYGKAIRDKEDFSYLHEEIMRSLMAVCRSGARTSFHAVYQTGSILFTEPVITETLPYCSSGERKRDRRFQICFS